MNDLNIIDGFMNTFSSYIDSGFGLLSGDVAFLSTTLIVIDVTLAGLFWAFGGEDNVLLKLIKKILYVGAFAYILNNFQYLSEVVYSSFAGLGLKAGGGMLTAADLLKPGTIAATGYTAAHPMLEQAGNLVGFPEVFSNLLSIFVLLFAWLIVVISFFILSIQIFIAVLEFKLTSLAGFILVPFALWNKTAFLAERVLGNVVASGVKMMVLAIIIGIGSTLFSNFTNAAQGQDFTLAMAMSQVLGALAFLGLGIFGPGIAAGLITGAPQLGAGAALGTTGAAVGSAALAGTAAWGMAKLGGKGGMSALRTGTALGSAASTSYQLGQAAAGSSSVGAGLTGVARAAGGAMSHTAQTIKDKTTSSFSNSAAAGRRYAWAATGGTSTAAAKEVGGSTVSSGASAPAHASHATRSARHAVSQAIKDGDKPAQAETPSLHQKD